MISGVVGPRTNYSGALAQEQWSCLPHAHQPEAAHAAPNLAGRQRTWSVPRRSAALAKYGPRGPQQQSPSLEANG